MLRTHTCGELNAQLADQEITICGRVNKTRKLGGMTFVDLRDRYGITQVVIDPSKTNDSITSNIDTIKNEFVLKITGTVIARPANMINKDMQTWDIEIFPTEIEVLSTSEELPFSIDHENAVGEEIRLEHRYLDLRRKTQQENLRMRHNIFMETMKFFEEKEFLYVETPNFIKNTPEGSREYVVPSRHEAGKFYVLPQSPQQLKQMLMVAWTDKYFQLARCFRDEDPRGDRQPEFTQVDFEMSFVEQEDIIKIIYDYFMHISSKLYPNKTIQNEAFMRMTWKDAMNIYGSDKPEIRTTEFSFIELTERAHTTEFGVFKNAECIKCIVAPEAYSRSIIEKELEPIIKENWGKWLAYLIFTEGEVRWWIVKFFTPEQIEELKKQTWVQEGQTLLFQATSWLECVELLWALRITLIKKHNLLENKENDLGFLFITDFPMFELNEQGTLTSMHHPFTKPTDVNVPYIKELGQKIREGYELTKEDYTKLLTVNSDGYDIVLNGYELGGWSIRIHDPKLQDATFALLWLSAKQVQDRFGHLLKSFSYGVPPHWGCAFGFDRIVMVYQNMPNLREVIPFPKNQKMQDLMLKAPSPIDKATLDELHLKIDDKYSK